MSKAIILGAVFFLFGEGVVTAENLYFPKTEADIIKALSQDDLKTITLSNGTKYEAEKGRVYKIIDGMRFRLRGLKVVEAIDILPKAGALINFDFDSAKISSESISLLDEFGKALRRGLPDAVVMITGHTDNKGTNDYNQKLSERRAQSVVEYLITSHGINSDRMIAKGFGETQPIADNDTELNRFKNRRVEFVRIE